MEDNLTYEITVDPEMLDQPIQSFLIQPFVENAVNHGLMRQKGSGKVSIRGVMKRKYDFEIEDDGEGMTCEDLDNLFVEKETSKEKHTASASSTFAKESNTFTAIPTVSRC